MGFSGYRFGRSWLIGYAYVVITMASSSHVVYRRPCNLGVVNIFIMRPELMRWDNYSAHKGCFVKFRAFPKVVTESRAGLEILISFTCGFDSLAVRSLASYSYGNKTRFHWPRHRALPHVIRSTPSTQPKKTFICLQPHWTYQDHILPIWGYLPSLCHVARREARPQLFHAHVLEPSYIYRRYLPPTTCPSSVAGALMAG